MKEKMTPEELIERIKGRKLKITPIVEIQGKSGLVNVCCDCSGCNNPQIAIDMFQDDPASGRGDIRFQQGKVRGYLLLEEEVAPKKKRVQRGGRR